MEVPQWIQLLSNAAVVGILTWNIAVIKKFIEALMEAQKLNHERDQIQDRAISQGFKIPFDSSAIAKGMQLFPVMKPRRES